MRYDSDCSTTPALRRASLGPEIMHVLARRVGLIGDGWACRVMDDALSAAGCAVVAVDTSDDAAIDPLLDVAVVISEDVERLRAAKRLGVACLMVRTRPPSDEELVDALLCGADGVLTWDDGVTQLCDAIRVVAEGGVMLVPADVRRMLDTLRRHNGSTRPRIELTAR